MASDMVAEPWIEWAGGECPVHRDTIVEVRLRGPSAWDAGGYANPAWRLDWKHGKEAVSDIIAFRVIAEEDNQ